MRRPFSVMVQGAIQEELATELSSLKVLFARNSINQGNDEVDCSTNSSDNHRAIVNPNGNDANDRHSNSDTSNDNDYHPTSILPPSFMQAYTKEEQAKDCTIVLS
jgi:hypothetical protein